MTVFNEILRLRRTQRRMVARVKSLAHPTGRDPNLPDSETEYKPLEWPILRKFIHLLAEYRGRYIIAVLVNLASTILDMLGPLFVKHLIDKDIPGKPHWLEGQLLHVLMYLHPATAGRFTASLARHPSYWAIGCTIFLWAAAQVLALNLQRFNIEYGRRTGEFVLFGLRKRVFAHLQRLSMSFYDKTKFGRILSRGTSDIDAMWNPIVNGLNTVVLNTLMMLVAAAILLLTDWRIALSVLWLGPVLFFMNRIYKTHIGQRHRVAREGYTRVSTNLCENINGMRVVTAYNRQEENIDAFNELQTANTENFLATAFLNGVYQPLLTVIGFLGKIIIFIFGCYLIVASAPAAGVASTHAAFTVGTLVAALMYWDWFMNPVLNFGVFHNEMMMAMASAERVFALLEQQPDVADAPGALAVSQVRGHVVFDHVGFSYNPDKPVLHDICFEALPGQTVALVGHTGCGKSTIINLICRFYQPQSGKILLDGQDLRTVTGESLHVHMGIVSQSNYLFSGTVLENIRYARPEATREEIVAAAKVLDSHDILAALKDGYDTQVGERGSAMSLGQRQLICFTRAFLANPRILMLDEATSAVDTHTEMLIQQALERLVQDRTTFIVAHRLSTVTRANMVLVLDHGKIIERGTHPSLLALNGKYAELYKQFTREV